MTERPTVDREAKARLYGWVIEPPQVDAEKCTGCGKCTTDCPAHVFEVRQKKSTVVGVDHCIACGHCWAVCPERAVRQPDSVAADEPDFGPEPPVSADDFEVFLRQRRSVRRFKSKPISREVLERIAKAGGYAPTGSNRQNVGIIVVPSSERVAELRSLTEQFILGTAKKLRNPVAAAFISWRFGREVVDQMLAYGDRLRWLMDAGRKSPYFPLPFGSAVMVAHADGKDSSGPANSVLALHTAALLAQAEGLGTCNLGFVSYGANADKPMKAWLGVPPGQTCSAAIVLGYPETDYLRPVARRSPTVTWR
ncbi:MAG: nitroreductase family protein [Deltaproteobacteria bacterium]|nr:nitroreductase family protein [Deltaproteobacteria bacterium]